MRILCFCHSNDPHPPLHERIRNKSLFSQRHLHLKIHSHLIYKVHQIMNSLAWTHFLNLSVTLVLFRLCWVFTAAQVFLQLRRAGAALLLQGMGSQPRSGFSRHSSWALECRLSSCGAWAQIICLAFLHTSLDAFMKYCRPLDLLPFVNTHE